ncbi:MAG: RNA polymerase sigma factor SigW [Planctomycetota bacterium]
MTERLQSARIGTRGPLSLPEFASEGAASDSTDGELIRRALAGDQEAFADLVARYQKRVFWIAFHTIGRVEDARDVAQEAFLRLHRSLHRYDFGRSFYTWFYRIVMNLAIDHLRKQRARPAGLTDLMDQMPGRLEDGFAAAERTDRIRQVWRVLDRMDSKFRAVLALRDIHGLSCREIAPILRVTHATVRWRLHRGRQMFKETWERIAGGAP